MFVFERKKEFRRGKSTYPNFCTNEFARVTLPILNRPSANSDESPVKGVSTVQATKNRSTLQLKKMKAFLKKTNGYFGKGTIGTNNMSVSLFVVHSFSFDIKTILQINL